jgi:hypothetical protein
VDDVRVHRGGRDDEALGDLLLREPAREQAQHLDLAVGQAARPRSSPPLRGLAGRLADGDDRLAVEQPVSPHTLELCGGGVGGEGRAVRSRLDERRVDVCGGQDAGGEVERGGPRATVIAAPVAPLVMHPREGGERSERLRPRQDPLAQVRMEANALPLVRGQRPRLLPDSRRDSGATQVVEEAGPA